jgi:hypothetical protein
MRTLLGALAIASTIACGNEVDHPPAAPGCDALAMQCRPSPPESGGVPIGGGEGGSTSDEVADWSGRVLAFSDDYFDGGSVFGGRARISAIGRSGARVSGDYDGSSFELSDVLKSAQNWFLVEPAAGLGLLPTLTVVDTRSVRSDGLAIGVARQLDVDGIFQLSLAGEAAPSRAQVVLRVVDSAGRSVAGVRAQLTAEVVAYRAQASWDATEGGSTDDSGMIFLGNVPAAAAIGSVNVALAGAVSARLDARVLAGATTVMTAVLSTP